MGLYKLIVNEQYESITKKARIKRIEYVTKQVKLSKAALAQRATIALVRELETQLGLDITDKDSEYFQFLFGNKEDKKE
jgi:hypothetical protein